MLTWIIEVLWRHTAYKALQMLLEGPAQAASLHSCRLPHCDHRMLSCHEKAAIFCLHNYLYSRYAVEERPPGHECGKDEVDYASALKVLVVPCKYCCLFVPVDAGAPA